MQNVNRNMSSKEELAELNVPLTNILFAEGKGCIMKLGIIIIFLFSFAHVQLRAQEKDSCAVHLKNLPQDGVLLDRGWKLRAGDNQEWASPSFNDSGWQAVDPTKDIKALPQLWQQDVVWLRLHLCVDSTLRQQPLVLLGNQTGASEVYLNGRLIKQLGCPMFEFIF